MSRTRADSRKQLPPSRTGRSADFQSAWERDRRIREGKPALRFLESTLVPHLFADVGHVENLLPTLLEEHGLRTFADFVSRI